MALGDRCVPAGLKPEVTPWRISARGIHHTIAPGCRSPGVGEGGGKLTPDISAMHTQDLIRDGRFMKRYWISQLIATNTNASPTPAWTPEVSPSVAPAPLTK